MKYSSALKYVTVHHLYTLRVAYLYVSALSEFHTNVYTLQHLQQFFCVFLPCIIGLVFCCAHVYLANENV